MSTKKINKKVNEQQFLDGLARMQGYKDSADKRANFRGFKQNDKHLIPISTTNQRYHWSTKRS
jgi:hypothetical protein